MTGAAWATLGILVANVLGGLTYPGQKLALEGLPPATVTFGRNLVGLACMGAWLAARGRIQWRFTRGEWVRLVLIASLGYAAPLLLGIVGTGWSTASNASVLILLEPASILVFSWLLLGEHIRRLQVIGVGLGLIGALCVVLEEGTLSGLLGDAHRSGNLVLVVHGILWGLYSPLMRPLVQRHRALDVTFWAMVVAQVLLLPAALVEHGDWSAGPTLVPALWWTFGLGVFGSFAATVLWSWSLRELKASAIAPFVFMQPLAGVIAGHLAFGEVLSPWALVGAVLIATGVVAVLWTGRSTKARVNGFRS